MFLLYTFSVYFLYNFNVLHQKCAAIQRYISNPNVISGQHHRIGSFLLKDVW